MMNKVLGTNTNKSKTEIRCVKPQILAQRDKSTKKNIVINKFKPTLWTK